MTTPDRPAYEGREDESGPASSGSLLDPASWRQLSAAATPQQLGESWLRIQARIISGVSCGVVLFHDAATGFLEPAALYPRTGVPIDALVPVVERAVREQKGIATRSDSEGGAARETGLCFLLAYPVVADGKVRGVAGLEIAARPQADLQAAMRQLQWGVAWLHNWVLRHRERPDEERRARLELVLELTARTLQEKEFRGAATAFVTELATRLGCDRVSLGFVRGNGDVKVEAVSHSAQFGKQMNLIAAIAAAMEESVEQQALLSFPEPGDGARDVLQAHQQLARGHGDQAVCTVPFLDAAGEPIGAVTLERSAPEPFDESVRATCDAVAAVVGPILDQQRRNDRPLIVKVGHSLSEQAERLFGAGHLVRKLVAAGLVVLALVLILVKGEYRVTAAATLEGEVQRVVVAPYRGFVFEAPVRAGDIVGAGQLMAALDQRDLRIEFARWSSEREQYSLEHRKAMAEGDLPAMKVLSKKIAQAEAQIELLQEQLNRARIVAPFDALVVSGDLSQSLGAPVDAGQVLFEVAPLEAYRLMLRVDEKTIRDVAPGQRGELVLTALPERRLGFRLTRITPVTVSEEGASFFLVESALDEVSEDLRPGMEGFGKITIDRRRLIWIWTHPMIDWVRLKAWTWLP